MEIHYCLTKLYFGFFVKKIHYIAISKNCKQCVFSQYIEGIIKAKVHEQIKQSDYVLFSFSKNFFKKFFENATNFTSRGSYGAEREKREDLNHSVTERG
jgi:hypothetical protein